MPGTLAFIGSPWPDVLKMMYCACAVRAARRPVGERAARVQKEGRRQAGRQRAQPDHAGAQQRRLQCSSAGHHRALLTSRLRSPTAPGRRRRTWTAAPRWRTPLAAARPRSALAGSTSACAARGSPDVSAITSDTNSAIAAVGIGAGPGLDPGDLLAGRNVDHLGSHRRADVLGAGPIEKRRRVRQHRHRGAAAVPVGGQPRRDLRHRLAELLLRRRTQRAHVGESEARVQRSAEVIAPRDRHRAAPPFSWAPRW